MLYWVFPQSFPPGGGTISNQAYVTLPKSVTISSASMDLAASGDTGKTSYIWLPGSSTNKVIQLKTSDSSLVHVFQNGADGCSASAFKILRQEFKIKN